MLKRGFSFLLAAVISMTAFAIAQAEEAPLYNVAYRVIPTLNHAEQNSDAQKRLWRLTNGFKGSVAQHDFFQIKKLPSVDTTFELLFDLKKEYPVEKIAMTSGNSIVPVDFEFLTSVDGQEWVSFGSKTDAGKGYTQTVMTNEAINARYVKMVVSKCNELEPAISEIEIFSKVPAENVALGKPVSLEGAAVNGANVMGNGVDGIVAMVASTSTSQNFNTNQAQTKAKAGDPWVYTIDLEGIYTIDRAVVAPGKSAAPQYFTIETSVNKQDWEVIVTETAGRNYFVPNIYEFTPADARYVRLNVTSSNADNAAISEFELFGELKRGAAVCTKDIQKHKTVEASIPTQAERELCYAVDGISGTAAPVLNNFAQFQVLQTTVEQDNTPGFMPEEPYEDVQWDMTIDLGRPLNFTTVKVVPGKSLYVKKFKIFASMDKEQWVEIIDEQNGKNNYETMAYELVKTKARYIKFQAIENSHWKPCVSEIIIENNENENLPVFEQTAGSISGINFMECTGMFPEATLDGGNPEYFVAEQGAFGDAAIEGNTFKYMSKSETAVKDIIKIGADNGNGDYAFYEVTVNLATKDIGDMIQFDKAKIEPGDVACTYKYMTNNDEKAAKIYAVALYKDGYLVDLQIPSATADAVEGTSERTAVMHIPDDESNLYTIKAFVWNDWDTLAPYAVQVLE